MSEITGPTHCCLAIIARILACLTRCVVSAQEALNTVWYRFALCTAKKAGRWPNYTTGELYDLPELRYDVRRGRVEEPRFTNLTMWGKDQMRLQCKDK